MPGDGKLTASPCPALACFVVADMYKGQERTRTIDILLDGEVATSWVSSGSSDGFETVPLPLSVLGQPTSSIELIGVDLADSDWLSIEEVRYIVLMQ